VPIIYNSIRRSLLSGGGGGGGKRGGVFRCFCFLLLGGWSQINRFGSEFVFVWGGGG